MFTEVLLALAMATVMYFIFFYNASQQMSHPDIIQKQLPRFKEFFTLLTDDKTANHVGSSAMKSLRAMLDLPKLEPVVLRAWSKAVRKNAGTFSKVREETMQVQQNIGPNEEYAQLLAQCEFDPIPEANFQDKKSDPVVLGCLVRFPMTMTMIKKVKTDDDGDDKNASNDASAPSSSPASSPSFKSRYVGFHVLPPADNNKTPFDIASFIDPMDLDQFSERAVEALFDPKHNADPMEGLIEYCVKPLQDLYRLDSTDGDKQKEKSKKEEEHHLKNPAAPVGNVAEKTNSSSPLGGDNDNDDDDDTRAPTESKKSTSKGLPPAERRAKLASDLKVVKMAMGADSQSTASAGGKKFEPTTTMTDCDVDSKIFPSMKTFCPRVSITGPNRDCIVTLFVILDPQSPFGCSIAKYQFSLTANKQRMMVFDQDSGSQMASC